MTALPTDEIVFSTVPSLTTCSSATIEWMYLGPLPPTSNYSLVITNIGIDQGGDRRRERPLVPRQSTTTVNMTLSVINPVLEKFNWSKVNVAQGRYRLYFYISDDVLSSNTFAVANGADMTCLAASSQSSTPLSSTPSPTPSPHTPSTSSPSVTPPAPVVGGSSVNKGVIAGVVVSGVVAILIAALALWLLRYRKARDRNATPTGSVSRGKGQGSRGLHNPSDSMGAILDGGNQANSPQMSEEDFDSEKSTVAWDHTNLNPTPTPIAAAYSQSSRSSRRPASMTIRPSFESHETSQSRPSRPPRRSLDSNLVPPSKTPIPSQPPPSYPPPDRTRRSSRKPVPAYDPNEFPSSQPNGVSLARRSQTSLGGGTKMYYIIPDAPLKQRK